MFSTKKQNKKIIIEIEKGQKKINLGTFLNRVSQDINEIYGKIVLRIIIAFFVI